MSPQPSSLVCGDQGRERGYYWVKTNHNSTWVIARWDGYPYGWTGALSGFVIHPLGVIGPRIEEPKEPPKPKRESGYYWARLAEFRAPVPVAAIPVFYDAFTKYFLMAGSSEPLRDGDFAWISDTKMPDGPWGGECVYLK